MLTLEYFDGVRLLEADLDPERRAALARTVLDTAFRQLFEDGLFHADPHPGNFLLLPDGDIGLIDFGLVGRLTRQMREQLVILIVAVALKDSESVARLLYRIGAPDARANIAAFRSDIDGVLGRHLPRTLGEVNARHLLGDLLDLAVKYRVPSATRVRAALPRLGLDGGHPPAALARARHPRRRAAVRQGAARRGATTWATSRADCCARCSASRGWRRTCRRSSRRSSSISRPGGSACTSARRRWRT